MSCQNAQSHPDPGPDDHQMCSPPAQPEGATPDMEEDAILIKNLEDIEDCTDCQNIQKVKLETSCAECGEPSREEDIQMCHLGLDVIGLFPSMQQVTTGEIVRRRAMQSSMQMPSFCTKQGGRYIMMNPNLTGPLGKLRRVLPSRRFNNGSMPGMTNDDLN